MYTILGLNGVEYGPVDLETLKQWAVEGRVQPGTLVTDQVTDRRFPAHELPELVPFFTPPKPPTLQEMVRAERPSAPPVRAIRPAAPAPHAPQPPGTIRLAPGSHSPAIAVLLSLLCLPGLGQIYNKQITKGIVVMLSSLGLGISTAGMSLFVTYLLAAIDAGRIGGRLDRGEPVGEWQFF